MERLNNNLGEKHNKRNPLKIASLTPKQLNDLLHPTRTEEQKAAIKVVKARIEKIKNDKNRSWFEKLEGDIQKAEKLGLDMTRYKKKLAFLEEEMLKAAIKKNETSPNKPAEHNTATLLRHMEAAVEIMALFEKDPKKLKEELDSIKKKMQETAIKNVEERMELVKKTAPFWLEELEKRIQEAKDLGLVTTRYEEELDSLKKEKQIATIKTVSSQLDSIKNWNPYWLAKLEKDIQRAEELELDMTKHKEELLSLKQTKVIQQLESHIKSLKQFKNTIWSGAVKQDIKEAKDLGIDTKRYEEEFSILEKEAHMNDIIRYFINYRKSPDTKIFKEALVRRFKEGLSLGITYEELKIKLMDFTTEQWKNIDESLKEKPIDFTALLNDEAWDNEK